MEGTIAEIRMFAGNFAPKNWAFCSGQLIPIASNTALFSLLGTFYGGNGQTTFGLPNLSGRVPVGAGAGPGLPNVQLGEVSGQNSVTLLATNLPAHNHTVSASGSMAARSGAGNTDTPTGSIPASSASDEIYAAPAGSTGTMAPMNVSGTTSIAGSNSPVSVMQPYLGMNYIICMFGIYPSRN